MTKPAVSGSLAEVYRGSQWSISGTIFCLAQPNHVADNQEVAQQLEGSPRGSSQRTILAFQETVNAWPNRPLRCEAIPPGRVHVRWIPGHVGIAGNEQADEQAKKGARSTPQTNPPARYAWARRTLKEEFWRRFQSYWAENAPQQYRDLSIDLDKRPMNYPFPELPSVNSSLPGQGMETSPSTMSASDMKTLS
ncbi:hypothetical protein SI65_00672 [Aspergillus cristatus]|uniref:RNase H type-1 domain-containing protein n=1 Tax=Aspergillus cristatus TaxID=573508 RepID=A0A1E3BQ28_ASPCR|nr:hypothetical protein SI65_00672 [Aspergillus cristatus]